MEKHFLKYLFLLILTPTLISCRSVEESERVTAAAKGDLSKVKYFIEKANSVNIKANEGWTPLTVSAREGHIEIVKFLLERGADVNTVESGGHTALFWASFNGHSKRLNPFAVRSKFYLNTIRSAFDELQALQSMVTA